MLDCRYRIFFYLLFYSRYLTPANTTGNPWFSRLWKVHYDCTWDNSTEKNCKDYENSPFPEYPVTGWMSKVYDGAHVFALGLDALIRDKCPDAFDNPSLASSCIKGRDLLAYLKNVTFYGVSGRIKFDENGDMLGQYDIYQYISGRSKPYTRIGGWDKDTEELTLSNHLLKWDLFRKSLESTNLLPDRPESVCSKECQAKEYAIQQELPCCWICVTCRNNEVIVNDSTCVACEETLWPDDMTALECVPIEPTYMHITDWAALALLLTISLGIAVTAGIISLLYRNKQHKLIKASSRELMAIIMVGIILAYLSVIFFLLKPTTASCHISHVGFNLSVGLIYAPLLLKTNRVYRIFTGGKRGVKELKYISAESQLIFTGVVFIFQVLLST